MPFRGRERAVHRSAPRQLSDTVGRIRVEGCGRCRDVGGAGVRAEQTRCRLHVHPTSRVLSELMGKARLRKGCILTAGALPDS